MTPHPVVKSVTEVLTAELWSQQAFFFCHKLSNNITMRTIAHFSVMWVCACECVWFIVPSGSTSASLKCEMKRLVTVWSYYCRTKSLWRGTEWQFTHYVNASGVSFTTVVISLCETIKTQSLCGYLSKEPLYVNQCLFVEHGITPK